MRANETVGKEVGEEARLDRSSVRIGAHPDPGWATLNINSGGVGTRSWAGAR